MGIIKKLQTINTGEGVERRELSCTVGGNGTVTIQNSMEVPEETKNTATKWSSNPTSGHIPRENYNSKRYMHPSVHCSTIYNSQDIEAT